MRLFPTLTALLISTAPALAAPDVVVDTQITGSLVQQVMGDLGEVHVLLPTGADVHHHQMRPSDARALQDADTLIWTGPELTPWLERASETLGQDAQQLRLLEIDGTVLRSYDQHHEHDHDEDHDHAHSDSDPHAWLNPKNAALWVRAIATHLSAKDPENADTYSANAEVAATAFNELNARIRTQLAPVADKRFVVFHDAYGYFTEYYGLPAALAVAPGDASTPSAARISALHEQIAESGVTCAFPEFAQNTKLIEAATQGTGIRTGAPMDPQGSGFEQGEALYSQAIQGLADGLTDCLAAD